MILWKLDQVISPTSLGGLNGTTLAPGTKITGATAR